MFFLEHKMCDPCSYEVTKVKSNQTLSYDNFNGEIIFAFVNEAENWISHTNTFLTVQLRVAMTDESV